MGFPGMNAERGMEAFLMFLKANHWKGTHLRQQIKKFALLERRRGES